MILTSQLKKLLAAPIEKLSARSLAFLATVFFLTLLLSNILISYFSLPLHLKIWIIFLGIIIPSLAFIFFQKNLKNPLLMETLPPFPGWLLALLGLLALAPRFYHLTTLSSWPIVDEGIGGYFAVNLAEKWNWDLLQGPSQTPRLYTWLQALLFKAAPPSLTTLWLYPALWSALCVPMVWVASRPFFSRSFSTLMTAMVAFSFWPLFLGRFNVQAISMVFWEYLAIYILAHYLKTPDGPEKTKKILWLGLITGLGFYTYFSWAAAALLIGIAVLADPSAKTRRRLFLSFLLILTAACVASPLAFSLSHEYRGYFHHLWPSDWNTQLIARIKLDLSYFRNLFWGKSGGFFDYGPLWGGLLNPISTSLFLLGLVYFFRSFQKPTSLWILSGFFFFSLPAFLTNDFEMMRLTQWIPLLAVGCAAGAQFLLSLFPPSKRLLLFFLILGPSAAFDFYHLFQAYPDHWKKNPSYYGSHKSLEFYKAYKLLNSLAAQEGPGLILLNFNPDPYDQTLFVAVYSFNAAENPSLDPAQAKWAAVLSNIHEQPFLKKIFPEGKWVWLSEGLARQDGGLLLETIPLTPDYRKTLERWNRADQSLSELTNLVLELGVDPDQSQMMKVLQKIYPAFAGDLFLESRYWRIMALHHCASGNFHEGAEDYQKAIGRGYPQAHLYNELGCLWYREGNKVEARKSFERAARLKPNLTGSAENLKNLLLLGELK